MTYYDAAQRSLGLYTSESQVFSRLSGASSFDARPEYIYDGGRLGRSTPELIPLLHLGTMNGLFVKNNVQHEVNMQWRYVSNHLCTGCTYMVILCDGCKE